MAANAINIYVYAYVFDILGDGNSFLVYYYYCLIRKYLEMK